MSPFVKRFSMNYSSIQNLMQETIEKNKARWYAFVIITELSDID